MDLLSADEAKTACEQMMISANSGVILSAFFSVPAAEWILSLKPKNLTVVIRGRLSDFRSSAASLEAIKLLLDAEHKVFFNFALHAKVFYFRDQILVGSSNLTANGLNLLERGGNLELSTVVTASEQNRLIVERIVKTSLPIEKDTVQKLEDYISTLSDAVTNTEQKWPTAFFDEDHDMVIWCSDLPDFEFNQSITEDHKIWGEIARFLEGGQVLDATKLFEGTRIYRWLYKFVSSANERGLNFGAISSELHDQLSDDPSPRRKNIKNYQQNLYSFIERIDCELELFRPNHSQVLRIKPLPQL